MKYKILKAPTPINEEQLTELYHNEGWMLLAIITWQGSFYFYFYAVSS